jgi:hypothetical protein
LGDGEHFLPPEIRTALLKLHGLAMDVVNNGWDGKIKEMAELATADSGENDHLFRAMPITQTG